MAISDRLLGKKNVNGKPHLDLVQPGAALPGGEIRLTGKSLRPHELKRPRVQFGDVEGSVLISSDEFLVARVPEGATSGPVVVSTNGHVSNPVQVNSVTVIPAGAIVRGTVTKRGEYSPEMTLTSVIVNGKSHSVRTVSITFNEQISYPADSEVSFELVWPLELTH